MSNLEDQVDALQRRVSKASSKMQQLKGKAEAAKSARDVVVQECQSKNLKPENLGGVLTKLQKKFDTEKAQLTEKIEEVESSLESYQEG